MTDYEHLLYERRGPVTVITIILPRPGTAEQAAALAHVVNRA